MLRTWLTGPVFSEYIAGFKALGLYKIGITGTRTMTPQDVPVPSGVDQPGRRSEVEQ